MENRSFDILTRSAAGAITRRKTFTTLGAAGLLALIGPFTADAKKGSKKKKKNHQSDAPLECPPAPVDRCPAQANTCTTILTGQCGGDPSCVDRIGCCSLLATCDTAGFFACI